MRRCLVVTKEIKELAKRFDDRDEKGVAGLIALWQERNNKDADTYPSYGILQLFKDTLESEEKQKQKAEIQEKRLKYFKGGKKVTLKQQEQVDLEFTPEKRKARVNLIARMFSNELNKAHREQIQKFTNRIGKTTNKIDETELQNITDRLRNNRMETFNYVPVHEVFNRILKNINNLIDESDKNADKSIDDDNMDDALMYVHNQAEYELMSDNFTALADEATSLLVSLENIRVKVNENKPTTVKHIDSNKEGDSKVDELANDLNKEEEEKEHWMQDTRMISNRESLSADVRAIINNIYKLDNNGEEDRDDLGYHTYLDGDYVHGVLLYGLSKMVDSNDLMPMLNDMVSRYPWIKNIISELENDETLMPKFYQDLQKDIANYWIIIDEKQRNGTTITKTKRVNEPENVNSYLNEWRANTESRNLLDSDSIYNKNGSINHKSIDKGKKVINHLLQELKKGFSDFDNQAKADFIKKEKVFDRVSKLLRMSGISFDTNTLNDALFNEVEDDEYDNTNKITPLLLQLKILFDKIDLTEGKDSAPVDRLINEFGGVYRSIANMFKTVTKDSVEPSFTEKRKTYYSHVNPSYLGRLVNQIHNKEHFNNLVENEFKKYDWFYNKDNDEWLSPWLRKLTNGDGNQKSQHYRDLFDLKEVLHSNGVEYQDLQSPEYFSTLVKEFQSRAEVGKENEAWYHVPILSDAHAAKFIKFTRYVDQFGDFNKEGLIDDLSLVVQQELQRINLVEQRGKELQKKAMGLSYNEDVVAIKNFDMTFNKDGSIKNNGGSEFKFLPYLNNDFRTENGTTLKTEIDNIISDYFNNPIKAKETIESYIKEALEITLDEQFEKTYKKWYNDGFLNEDENGNLLYLDGNITAHNKRTANYLQKIKNLNSYNWTDEEERLLQDYANNRPINDEKTDRIFYSMRGKITSLLQEGLITKQQAINNKGNLELNNPVKDQLREYFYNSKVATSQIIQLTTSDLAFYKNEKDFQKRFKEIHAPGLRLFTNAKFNGELIGRKNENTIILKDQEILSNTFNDIKEVFDKKVANGEMTAADRDGILDQYKNVVVTDAQAYRSLSSYRAVLGMSGKWTNEMENAYNNIKNNHWNMNDFNMIWQPLKPFLYTQISNDSGIEGNSNIKTPVQHKNSEYLLMAMHSVIANSLEQSSKLKAMNKFMEDNNVDVIQFATTTKVGGQVDVDINDLANEADVYNHLKHVAFAEGGFSKKFNPNTVKSVPYEDYILQTTIPKHSTDATQLVDAQIRKLITSDINEDTKFKLNSKTLSKDELIELYNDVITSNIKESYDKVMKMFDSPKAVEEMLLRTIRGNNRYGREMEKACTLDENGEFQLPLYDPIQSQNIQNLLNSVIKDEITKQKINGGSLVQVSNFGLSDKLKIKFVGEGENKRIEYFECYMPAYSKKFFKPLMKKGAHELDIDKIPIELREFIGYTVPTKDKYSILPLRIKGFLPQQSGSSIMLPAETNTITGSKFDKLFAMFPAFKVIEIDYKQAYYDYAKWNGQIKEIANLFNRNEDIDEIAETVLKFKQWLTLNREKYDLGEYTKFKKIKYDFSKSSIENSTSARNNLMIDIMNSILTNSNTTSKILKPCGFDTQKRASGIITILNSNNTNELKETLEITDDSMSIIDKLQSMTLDELDKIAENYEEELDPLSPDTQIVLHNKNMTADKLIGIYANHNANHALMQYTNLALDPDNGAFRLNSKTFTSLHEIKNETREFISNNNGGFLAASVDVFVLAELNQNLFTVNSTMLLSRLGYNPLEIGLFLNQPIIKEITSAYLMNKRKYKSKLNEILSIYKKKSRRDEKYYYEHFKDTNFTLDELTQAILTKNNLNNAIYSKDYYFYQYSVGILFKRVLKTADALGKLVQTLNVDTNNGAAGSTIAGTQIKYQRIVDFIAESKNNKKFPLKIGNSFLKLNAGTDDVDNSNIKYMQAFFTYGLERVNGMLDNYFPQNSKSFEDVINALREETKSGKLDSYTTNNIYNDLFAYILSKTDFFGSEKDENGNIIATSTEKREAFIYGFPEQFNELMTKYEELRDNEFLSRLQIRQADKQSPVQTIKFQNVGSMSSTLKERYAQDWAHLLYMREDEDNPELKEIAYNLAQNLFRYSYYRNGFAFSHNTFIHLAPLAVRNSIYNYKETLNDVVKLQDDYSLFHDQYIMNHLDNRQLVPMVSNDVSKLFIDNKGNIKEEVTIDANRTLQSCENILRKIMFNGEGDISYHFQNFIAIKHKMNNIYYKLSSNNNLKPYEKRYTRVEPLGYKNNFIEYEYGKDAETMLTVIDKNKR